MKKLLAIIMSASMVLGLSGSPVVAATDDGNNTAVENENTISTVEEEDVQVDVIDLEESIFTFASDETDSEIASGTCGDKVTTIGKYAFYECPAFTTQGSI